MKSSIKILTLSILLTIGITINCTAQNVKWLTIEEAIVKSKTEKRKIFVDMYTDWCGWCKKMEAATFQKPHIAKYLNENFYPVKFNAEQKSDIAFKNNTFKFVKNGRRGYNELAAFWSRSLGNLSFPTIVFLDEDMNMIQPIPGYQDPVNFEQIMTFIGGDHFINTSWKSYSNNYQAVKY